MGTRRLNELKQLERDRLDLVTAIEASERNFHSFSNSKQMLSQLLVEHNFDTEMQKLGYPAKVLNGKINLDQDHQKVALDELSVTLGVKSSFPDELNKIITALKLYYKTYFNDGQPPQKVDPTMAKALQAFDADSEKGANTDFQLYLKSQEALSEADLGQLELTKLNNIEQKDFILALFAEWMVQSKNPAFLHHLLNLCQWDISHMKLLEHCYEKSADEDFAKACLDKILELGQDPNSSFLDHQLELDHHPQWIRSYLSTLSQKQLEERQKEALEQNLQHLLGALINLKGLDQKYFYQILGKSGLRNGVFKHLVDSLFHQANPQGVYGMDHHYAKQVLQQHRHSPANVIATLQKAMPRGLEGTQVQDFFNFLDTINQQLKTCLDRRALLESLNKRDEEFSKTLLEISDHQTIRFLLFSYIYDRIKTSNTNFKALGLSSDQLRDLLEAQYQFELQWGKNRNILNYIQNIRQKNPILNLNTADIHS
jgi:hypothetical protein